MDVTDLDRPGHAVKAGAATRPAARRPALERPLVRAFAFVFAGALLHVTAARFSNAPTGPVIEVTAEDVERLADAFAKQTGRRPGAEMREHLVQQEIDERLLIEDARARGWHRTDPVIRRRLIQNQRFLEAPGESAAEAGAPARADADARMHDEADDATLLARAYAQGMDRSDVVVKRRLLERMRLALAEQARLEPPPRDELEAYRAAHLALFRRPARLDLVQIFVSRDRHGERLDETARALGERLADATISDEDALALGDPSLLPSRVTGTSQQELARRFGADFAASVFAAGSTGSSGFSGPIQSSFGAHFVRVTSRSDERDPPLSEVLDAVTSRVEREREEQAIADFVMALRERAVIERRDLADGAPIDARGIE